MNAKALGVPDLAVCRTGEGVLRGPLPDDVRLETDLALALSKVDAAVIANPTSLHAESALEAVSAGCHVLIEKPLSHTLDGVEHLKEEVRRNAVVALVGYQFRFHPALRCVRRWLQEGAIGSIVSAHAHWGEYLPDWQPWRDYQTSYSARASLGGGVLLTLSHPIDYLYWLLGPVARVGAITACRSGLEIDVEDTALVQLEFQSGAVASVSLNYAERARQHSLTIVGRTGVIRWDDSKGIATLEAPGAPRSRWETASPPERFERNYLFVSEMSHFFNGIAGREEPVGSIEEGEYGLRICVAAKQAAREGRRIDI
jgi:predicted dehydrogenase